jgi:hypothetical protein
MSAHLMSSHLFSSHLISSLLFSSHIFQALLTSPYLTSALVSSSHPISASSSHVKTSYLSLLLTGASPLISVPSQRDTAAPFPCRRHEKFICKAVVCAVRNDARNPSSAALRADGTWISLRRLAACVTWIPQEFTWILRPRQTGAHGYPKNSYGSFDLDKEECTDTLGIHMDLSTLTGRIARIP